MPWWGWIAFGAIMFVAEILMATDFFLVFFGAAALVIGLAGAIGITASGPVQWLVFAALSIAGVVLFRNRLRRSIHTQEDTVDRLEGDIVVVIDRVSPGAEGHAEHRGTVWKIKNSGKDAISPGDKCKIDAVNGLILSVRRESE